ncbi:hypothetical protein F4778DRAFT_780065 [Xylariomycetidae sp. FL2044]|nr:hypothetical protein F4778DRAFT_780065 [Xylariomycetidae sp. FL2044]
MKTSFLTPLVALPYALGALIGERTTTTTTALEPFLEKKQVRVSVDCNELINQLLTGINNYPSYIAQAVAVGKHVGLPSATAYAVCKTFAQHAVDCTYASLSIGGGISLAVVHGFIDINPPAEGAHAVTRITRKSLIYGSLEDHLQRRGVSFDEISIRSPDEVGGYNMTAPSHFLEVRGVQGPDPDASTDYHIHSRDDGSGSMLVVPFAHRGMERRADSAGFKIAWEVSARNGQPPAEAADRFGPVIQKDWRSRVEADHDIGDYIGLIDFGTIGRIQFRIIPETKTFGENTEDVSQCTK